ncbi:FprA family A-type flavoprotein [Planctomycetota bacterium]
MRQIKDDIYALGAIDWDARLFDRLIPLPDGTSYNSYLIKGSDKTALIDTVEPRKISVLLDNLIRSGIDKLDYIISHHAEQDHSGSLGDILLIYPETKIVTNPKCKQMLMDLLDIEDESFITVEDGGTLSLGEKTLEFIYLPWVHWPETMATYLQEDKVLFSCDFFGAHLATSSLFADDQAVVYESAKRYYAEIMMPFRKQVNSNIKKLDGKQIDTIAPSHGPVHNNPEFIIDAYKDWASEKVKNEVLIPYVSMHGSTAQMVTYLVENLIQRGITVKQFELSSVDIGKLATALVDAATVVIGSPTVLAGAHPCAAYAAFLVNALRPKIKFASVIGSFGWGGRMVEQITGLMPNIKAEILEPVVVKGHPKDEDFKALGRLADKILAKHKELEITN